MAEVILGVTGGIAAYKACELCRLFVKAGDAITPVLTRNAARFVAPRTFEALARRERPRELYPHLITADLLVIAPLSANTLAKLAHGLADNLLTELALAFPGPVLAAPAMNDRMWRHAATQANVALLRERGVELIGPERGELAESERREGVGEGRMSEPEAIFARAEELLGRCGPLRGRRVVISAGGTREPVDTVRYLGNRSSGRMGVAVAAEAARRGASVTLLAANVSVPLPAGIEVVMTPTAADLAREAFARADAEVIVMAAAVADYRPVEQLNAKRKKSVEQWTLTLEPTTDVLAELGARRSDGQILVGFAADEGEAGLGAAREKRERKGVNLLVFNDVSRTDIGFEAEDNEVTLITAAGERRVQKRRKEMVAVAILDEIASMLGGA
jgi:phosphopantothenoylcysteine decarboxylase/phosphopantothenate--cysteine ligase